MKKLIALFVSVSIILTVALTPASAFEDTDYLNPLVDEGTSFEVLENEISAVQGGYTYNPPAPGNFLIENENGTLTIANETLVLHYGSNAVSLPMVTFYKIVDKNDNLRYYQADTLADPTQCGDFVYIALYVEKGTDYILHVQQMVDFGKKMCNIVAELSAEQYSYFDQLSTPFCMGNDDVSYRLKIASRAYTYGTSSSNNDVANSLAVPTALNSTEANSFDSYTDQDGIIKSYVQNYFLDCYTGDGYTYKDDPIIQIVPKELFFIEGEHIYVGKEYGFFVRVLEDPYQIEGYTADVLVFDITHTTPDFNQETGGARVEPLFQFLYRAATNGINFPISPDLSSAVFPHIQYDSAEYYLKDIGFRFTLENVDALNPGDAGYDPYKDDGAFIIQSRASASGVGLKKKDGVFLADAAKFGLGFLKKAGVVISAFSFALDTFNGFSNGGEYTFIRDVSVYDNEANINTLKTNSTDQISAYGGLMKTQSVALMSDVNSPRLINVGGGYAEAKYLIARRSDSDNNKLRVITSISVCIVADNTSRYWLFGWHEKGEVVSYGRATGTYETGKYKRLNDVSLNGNGLIEIPAGTQRHIIKLTPAVSGSYKMITLSSVGDPHFYITNASKGTSTVVAKDDNSSSDRNAELTIELIAGDTYYIEAFNFSRLYGYLLRIGYSPVSTHTLMLNTPFCISTAKSTYDMLKFTPTVSGYYEFSTNRTSGDPQLFVFYASGAMLSSNDDSGGDLNAYIRCYLSAGQTYYIAAQGYKGNSAVFNVIVTHSS